MSRSVFLVALLALTGLAAVAHHSATGGADASLPPLPRPVAPHRQAFIVAPAGKIIPASTEPEELRMARQAAALGAALMGQPAGRRTAALAAMHFRACLAYEKTAPAEPIFPEARQALARAEARLADADAPRQLGSPREVEVPVVARPAPPPPPAAAPLGVSPEGVPFEAARD